MPGTAMAAEMAEQPGVLAGLIDRRADLVAKVRSVSPDGLLGVVLVARGSSDHAAIFGRYVLELATGRPVALAAPSLSTLYGATTNYGGYLAVAVSQSGRTPEIVTVLERMRASGARTLAITNTPGSPLEESADASVMLDAGEEEAVPATKTFTAQLVAFALVAEALGPVRWDDRDWSRLAPAVTAALEEVQPPREVADEIATAEGLISVGRGFLFAVALEAALKLKETSGLLAEGYSAADLRHGPIATVAADLPVLAFSSPGPAEADIDELAAGLGRLGAPVFLVSERTGAQLPLVPGLPEPLVTVPATVRAQQLAYELALRRGVDPDSPLGLSKVTLTK